MAYENEKNRLASLLTNVVGITRTRDSDLEREAQERAIEARYQTGMNIGSDDGVDAIPHPTQEQRQARLGVPASTWTAELATWNYQYNDPVKAASDGLLNSSAHRAVLDNPDWKYWGIGIHTEMPSGSTDELQRRWWFILWFSTKAIGSAAVANPTEALDKKVSFGVGTHFGYKFGYDGRILSSKAARFDSPSRAQAKGRGRIPGRAEVWLLIANGVFAEHWVQEDAFAAYPHPKLT